MNNKIKLKILRNIINCIFYDFSKSELIEDVLNNKNTDIDCQSIIDALEMIMVKKISTLEEITNLYYLIFPTHEKKNLDVNKLKFLVRYLKNNDQDKIFKYILKNNIFNEYSYIIAIYIFNSIYYSLENKLIVFYTSYKRKYIYYSKKTFSKFKEFHNLTIEENEKYYTQKKIYTLEQIHNKIHDSDLQSINILAIKELYIFGSYAKKNNNQFSDIDFFVILDLEQQYLMITQEALKKHLYKIFETNLDVHVTSLKLPLSNFERNILNYAIKII